MTTLVVLWLNRHYQLGRESAVVVTLVPTLPAAFLAWAAYRDDRSEATRDLDLAARTLAAAVKVSGRDQVASLLGAGGRRIDVVFDYLPTAAHDAAGTAARGQLADVLAYYRNLRPARLLITGAPGAGKSLLALQLLIDVLDDPARTDTDPVPVPVSVAGWDTLQPLTQWLAEQIHQRYGSMGITSDDAHALVSRRRVLPVLDGLDEMDHADTPPGRRRSAAAVVQLNDYQDTHGSAPLVLTCRTEQYEELAATNVLMLDAARVQIRPVSTAQATAYLTARVSAPLRWAPVLAALTAHPAGSLARALDTPWRLNLAVTVFEQRDPQTHTYVRDPADLLGLVSPDAIRDHLLARRIQAATAQHPSRYSPHQVQRWLSRLATHLAGSTGTEPDTDVVLHQLWTLAGPRRVRAIDAVVTAFLTSAVCAALLDQRPSGFSSRQLLGVVLLVVCSAGSIAVNSIRPPRSAGARGNPARRHRLTAEIAVLLATALAFGLAIGLGGGWGDGWAGGWGSGRGGLGAVIGPAVKVVVGAMVVVVFFVGSPTIFRALAGGFIVPTDPRHPIRDDLVVGLTIGVACAIASGTAVGVIASPGLGATAGLALGLVTGFWPWSQSAARRYLVFLCVCRGRLLPWRLGAFLNWSYEAGLLRISGIAYQFRHRELQDWLIANPTR
ncbi:NACHT domain-containing protein [Streptomyces sp. NPDC004031]